VPDQPDDGCKVNPAGLAIFDNDGYLLYAGPLVKMKHLKKLFKGGTVWMRLADGEIVEYCGRGTGPPDVLGSL
jgi:hypothetical protein